MELTFSNSTAGQPIYSLSKKLLCYQNIPLLYTVQCTVTLLCIKNSETNWRGLPIAFKLLLKIAPNSVFLTHSMYLRGTPYTPANWNHLCAGRRATTVPGQIFPFFLPLTFSGLSVCKSDTNTGQNIWRNFRLLQLEMQPCWFIWNLLFNNNLAF